MSKKYKILFSQQGESNPTVKELQNELSGIPVFERGDGAGSYTAILSAAFPADKTLCPQRTVCFNDADQPVSVIMTRLNSDTIQMAVMLFPSGDYSDFNIVDFPISIEVFE